MTKEKNFPSVPKSEFLKIIITAVVSLIVGVSSGLVIDYFKSSVHNLEYTLSVSDAFKGQMGSFAIMQLEIINSGKKEVENLVARIEGNKDEFVEAKVSGLPPSSCSHKLEKTTFQLDTPFLNPKETISVQLLVSPNTEKTDEPTIKVRAKGIVGKQKVELSKKSKASSLMALIPPISLTVLTAFLMLTRLRSQMSFGLRTFGYTTSHKDDQRDVFSYILNLNGLPDEAEAVRKSPRNLSYWAESDRLTNLALSQKDNDKISRLVNSFEHLKYYAAVEDTSCMLINTNIARLYVNLGEVEKAKEALAKARSKKHKVIEKRIELDENLRKVAGEIG